MRQFCALNPFSTYLVVVKLCLRVLMRLCSDCGYCSLQQEILPSLLAFVVAHGWTLDPLKSCQSLCTPRCASVPMILGGDSILGGSLPCPILASSLQKGWGLAQVRVGTLVAQGPV